MLSSLLFAAALSATPQGMERVGFSQAVERALGRNPSVEIARQEVKRAEALVRESQAAWLPTLSANGTYTRLDADRKLNGNTVAAQDQLGLNAQLAVPLFAPQRWLATSRQNDLAEAARASSADTARVIAQAAGRAWLTVLAQKRALDVAERARDTAKAHLDYADQRLRGGVGNRLDEVRARSELATDEALLAQGATGLVRAREALGVLLGLDAPLDADENAQLPQLPALNEALQQARSRADVKAQESRTRAADRAVEHSYADYLPLLTATFQPFYQHPASLTTPQTGWQAVAVLSLPLYDGGFRYGAQRERQALSAEAHAQLDSSLRQASSDVRAAFEAVRLADQQLGSAREAAKFAEDAAKLADLAYRAGAVNNLEVVDAERRARDAEATAASAEDTARQARLDLLVASGRFP